MNLELHKDIINSKQFLKKGRLGLTLATVWMNLEDVTPSEISELQEDTYYVSPLTQGTENCQIHRDRKKNAGCQGLGEGDWELILSDGDRVSVWDDELEVGGVMNTQQCVSNSTELYAYKWLR